MNAVQNFATTVAMLGGLSHTDQSQAIAQALNWCGDDIFAVMCEALTEANFHAEAQALHAAWRNARENEELDA